MIDKTYTTFYGKKFYLAKYNVTVPTVERTYISVKAYPIEKCKEILIKISKLHSLISAEIKIVNSKCDLYVMKFTTENRN